MKRLLVLIFIILISCVLFVSAQNISIDYPNKVYVNEEFSINVKITNFSNGNYDIKFDTKLYHDENLFQVFDGTKWKSNHFYLKNTISNNQEKKFVLKTDYIGEINFRVRVRKTETTTITDFESYSIKSLQTTTQEENDEKESEEEDSEEEESTQEFIKTTGKITENLERRDEEVKPIVLNPQNIKTEVNSEKENGNRAVYSFVAFSVLLAFLFWIKRKKYRNEFT